MTVTCFWVFSGYLYLSSHAVLVGWDRDPETGAGACHYFHPLINIETRLIRASAHGCDAIVIWAPAVSIP